VKLKGVHGHSLPYAYEEEGVRRASREYVVEEEGISSSSKRRRKKLRRLDFQIDVTNNCHTLYT
jgi:ribosomal protein L31